MRILMLVACAVFFVVAFGFALGDLKSSQRSSRAMSERGGRCAAGTNGVGRSSREQKEWGLSAAACQEGRDEFGRTAAERSEYVKSFDLPSFLGHRFGSPCKCGCRVKLGKPFGPFGEADLGATAKGRMYSVSLRRELKGVGLVSVSNEYANARSLLRNAYKLPLNAHRTGFGMISGNMVASWKGEESVFRNDLVEIKLGWRYGVHIGVGELYLIVSKDCLRKADAGRED